MDRDFTVRQWSIGRPTHACTYGTWVGEDLRRWMAVRLVGMMCM